MGSEKPQGASGESSPGGVGSVLIRSLKIALLLLVLALGGIAIAAMLGGDPSDLPFEYQGFD